MHLVSNKEEHFISLGYRNFTASQIVYFLGKPGGYPTFSYSDICFEFSISDRFGWILLYKHMMEK